MTNSSILSVALAMTASPKGVTKLTCINVKSAKAKTSVISYIKPQSHRAYDQVTTYLRPKMLESWANRRKNVRLVAEVVGDRQGKISCSKVVVMFKTPKAPVTPGLRPGYDLPATEKCWNRGQIVEGTYDWSHRSWVIARAKSVVASSMVMQKLLTCDSKSFGATIDRTIGRR